MKKINKIGIVGVVALALSAIGGINAAVIVEANYHLGENGLAVDSSVNGRDFTAIGTGNTGTLNPISSINPAGNGYTASTTYFVGNGSSTYLAANGYNLPLNNFGVEVYVRTASLTGLGSIINSAGGNTGTGFEIVYDGSNALGGGVGYGASFSGVAYVGGNYQPLTTSEWVHLALVRDNGVSTFYVNGVATGSTTSATPNAPTAAMNLGVRSGGSLVFNGAIDEVRLFTFSAGQFSTSDLLFNTVPEPSGMVLLLIVLPVLAIGYRRRLAFMNH
jgi:hypothetical protein